MDNLIPALDPVVSLGQYGIVGVLMLFIIVQAGCIYLLFTLLKTAYQQQQLLVQTHIENQNEIFQKFTQAFSDLKTEILRK